MKLPIFTFKKIQEADLPLLFQWFNQPHVAKWWPTIKEGEFLAKFLSRITSSDTFGYIVFMDSNPIGYIQYYYIDRLHERPGSWLPADIPVTTVGIDQFIGIPEYIGKGYGTQFIKEFIKFVSSQEPWVTTIIVDPDPQNLAAIRAYEKVGFKRIGIFEIPSASYLLMRYDFMT